MQRPRFFWVLRRRSRVALVMRNPSIWRQKDLPLVRSSMPAVLGCCSCPLALQIDWHFFCRARWSLGSLLHHHSEAWEWTCYFDTAQLLFYHCICCCFVALLRIFPAALHCICPFARKSCCRTCCFGNQADCTCCSAVLHCTDFLGILACCCRICCWSRFDTYCRFFELRSTLSCSLGPQRSCFLGILALADIAWTLPHLSLTLTFACCCKRVLVLLISPSFLSFDNLFGSRLALFTRLRQLSCWIFWRARTLTLRQRKNLGQGTLLLLVFALPLAFLFCVFRSKWFRLCSWHAKIIYPDFPHPSHCFSFVPFFPKSVSFHPIWWHRTLRSLFLPWRGRRWKRGCCLQVDRRKPIGGSKCSLAWGFDEAHGKSSAGLRWCCHIFVLTKVCLRVCTPSQRDT